jgi:hypothetical protein
MKTKYLLIAVTVFTQISCNSQLKKINGLSFVASKDTLDASHTKPVIKVHSNFVALMPFGFMRKIESPEIIHNSKRQWFGETEAGLIQYAEEFKKNNIKVMVKPQIWVWNGTFTGFIEMDSEENWQTLEKSYSSFILTYAKSAQKMDADILCIGTELEKFILARPNYWKQLIKEIRKIYKGKLTYAANWDEYKRVPFLAQLDFIGIDAYFPLSDLKSPTIADFEKGWQPHKEEIKRIQKQYQKPILFTEYGYRSVDFTGKKPWFVDDVDGNVNLKSQADAIRAIHNQFWKEEWFAGGFIWKWFHVHDKVGGENDNRFTPQNKPAELVIKNQFQQ